MILKTKAYIIDREVGTIIAKNESDDYLAYVDYLLDNIEKSTSLSYYTCENPSIGVIASVLDSVNKFCENPDDEIINESIQAIASRFLLKETEAQEKVERLRVTIKVGCLIQSIIQCRTGWQYLIAKVDSTDYLNNFDLKRNRGFEISDKRLGKSCLIDISNNEDGKLIITQIRILLDNSASYFYKDFLEVVPVYQDDYNTNKMMATVLKCVDDNLKKVYPQQRLLLKNAFIHHVRANEFINYSNICNVVFKQFLDSPQCDISADDKNKLMTQLQELPEKKRFSPQFNKVAKEVKARVIESEYRLNNCANLIISDVEQVELLRNIQSGEDPGGRKFIKVYTTDEEAIAAFAPQE